MKKEILCSLWKMSEWLTAAIWLIILTKEKKNITATSGWLKNGNVGMLTFKLCWDK